MKQPLLFVIAACKMGMPSIAQAFNKLNMKILCTFLCVLLLTPCSLAGNSKDPARNIKKHLATYCNALGNRFIDLEKKTISKQGLQLLMYL
jgi:hypothetical protein